MDGLMVRFRWWEVRYFPAGELVRVDEPIMDYDEMEDRDLAGHTRMRRIVFSVTSKSPLRCYYLHWSDGSDLEVLDELVVAGMATEDLFAGAIVGEAHSMAHYRGCESVLRTVVGESSLALFTDETMRWRSHKFQALCPACGQPWYAAILEYIGFGSEQVPTRRI